MEQLYIIESRIKRKAEYHICEQCKNVFLRRIFKAGCKKARKYCNKKCHEISSRTRIVVKCTNCDKKIEKKPSQLKNSKHGFYFCNRNCKEEAQKLGGKCPEIRPAHYGTSEGRETYRNLIRNSKTPVCEGCQENSLYLLQVHHRDKDRTNNDIGNLEVVCGNCHIKRHLYFKDGKWQFSFHHLTPRGVLLKI